MNKNLLKSLLVAGMLAVGVGVQAKVDVTDTYVKNANLSVDPKTADNGWTLLNNWYQDWRVSPDAEHVNVVEFYAGWGSLEKTAYAMSQTISLPAGYYRLAVNAFYREGNDGNGKNENKAYIFAGDKKQNVYALANFYGICTEKGYVGTSAENTDLWKASNAFFKGDFSNEFDFKMETDGDIEIGFKGTFDQMRSWVILGPVKLYEYTAADYQSDFDEKKGEAEALYGEKMNATVLSELKEAANATGFVTVDDVTSAIQTLNEKIAAAKNSIEIYNEIKQTIENTIAAIDPSLDLAEMWTAYNNGTLESVDELYPMFQKLEIAALGTADNTDFTKVIINPSFEWGNTFGWTVKGSSDTGAKENSNAIYTIDNADGDYVFNIWPDGNPISQTINGIPNGNYKLTALIATDAGKAVRIFANDEILEVAADDAGKGIGVDGELEFTVFDGTVTIGAEGVDKYWYKVDNFRLVLVKYLSDEDIQAAIQKDRLAKVAELKAKAEELIADENISNAAKEKLEEYLNYYELFKDQLPTLVMNDETYNTFLGMAEGAVDAAEGSIIATPILPKMKELTETTNVYTEEALKEYYSQWVVKYENGTLTKAEASALQDPFVVTGWHASITCDNFLLSAWDAKPDFADAYYINTWSLEGEGDGSDFKVPFFEYWTSDDNSLGERTLTATLEGIPSGTYTAIAWVRVRVKNTPEGEEAFVPKGITMQLNDGEVVDVTTGNQVGTSQFYLKEFAAKGEVAEDGILKIKFMVAADNTISWLSFKNVNYVPGDATGIKDVNTVSNTTNNIIFNLAGQRVQNAQKGLYIQNGKKVVKK